MLLAIGAAGVAGAAGAGLWASGGGAPAARDRAGNLLIAAGAIHVVAARTGTFYGMPMTAGHIYTIPPAGLAGTDVRADPAGNLVTIVTNDLCNSNCADTPGSVRVLAQR